jgi:hypothetical protein
MIEFEFHRVLSGWWAVTIGRSLDDIEYSVIVDDTRYPGAYCRLDELVALYECTVTNQPTATHPRRTAYDLREVDTGIELEVNGRWVSTRYEELQESLAPFLSDVFSALNAQSATEDGDEKEVAIAYMRTIESLRPFGETYAELTE